MLIASNGVFGERMAAMAVRQGADVSVVRFDPGEPVDAEQVRRKALAIGPKLLAVVHGETSTGVINPVPELGHIAREVGALFSVDAVTTVGMLPFPMADWNIDYAYTGSQKCLSAPPGLAPVAFSKNAIDAVRNRRTAVTTWYADALDMMRYWLPSQEGRQYHHTVPVQLHWATGEAIRAALEEGVLVRARRVETLAWAVLESLEAIGFGDEGFESYRLPTVLAVRLPEGFDDQRVRHSLRFDHNISVAGGLGPTAGTIWRLGLMGENAHPDHYLRLMEALEQVLAVGGLRRRLERALVSV